MYHQTAIRCTLNNVPMTASTLQKSRLPFGVHIYPFAYDETVPISEGLIVRCKFCRAYINPYVRICDTSSWQCNLCNRMNELPPQFVYNYDEQVYYDLGTKSELTSETIEYIASVEYMVRPPQPACYIFVFDCSRKAFDFGYISVMAEAISELLDQIPGDARASIGFIAFDSNIHYFSFTGSQVVHHVCADVNTEITPCPRDGILVNISMHREMILDFLNQVLPNFPQDDESVPVVDDKSCMGAAVKAAIRILTPIGGRITVIQAQLPNYGSKEDGSILTKREDVRSQNFPDKNGEHLTPLLNPATDFYKNLALQCCENQVSIDVFNLSTDYADLASISPMTKYSAGTLFHYSNSPEEKISSLIRFNLDIRNYLTRPLGFESVLRLRCSKGLKVHTFHGNFFVRSPNLLVLPNTNPDSSYALQIAIEDDIKPETRFIYFQAALLYTTPEGQRRIRVHTSRYPTVTTLPEVIYGANQIAIVGMLAKMAVDRSVEANVGEAKEALIGASADLLEIYSIVDPMRASSYAMSLPENLRLIPLYVLALLKHIAFKMSPLIRLDERTAAMERFKTLPIDDLITYIYPDLYPLHNIANDLNDDFQNPLQLTAAHLERNGAYLLDAYDVMIIYVCEAIDPQWCYNVFQVQSFGAIREYPESIRALESGPSTPANTFGYSAGKTSGYGAQNYPYAAIHNGPQNYDHNIYTTQQNSIHQSRREKDDDDSKADSMAGMPLMNLPELSNTVSLKLREFINCLIDTRPQKPKFYVLKDNSRIKSIFTQYLIDDRSESCHSYVEFLKFLQGQTKK